MAQYRGRLPQLGGHLFLTDGGIETTLIYHDRFDLPFFAAFDLLKGAEGTAALKRYFSRHAVIARDAGSGFILESPTWRASPDWGAKLGYSAAALDTANRADAGSSDRRGRCRDGEYPRLLHGELRPPEPFR